MGSFVRAVDTLILMSAQSSGTAALHSPIGLQLLIAEDCELFEILAALATDDIGHFDGRPRHGRRGR